jgi:acetyl esterase/lipase
MRRLIWPCLALALFGASAWQPPPGHAQLPIWPHAAPDAIAGSGPEDEARTVQKLIAGRPWIAVGNVVRPTMTVYAPKGRNSGAAIVVFPGGGYENLAIDLEGTEVCDWVASRGMTCVLLKYRVPGPWFYPKPAPYPKSGPYPFAAAALQDAQRAVGLVRFRAAEWHVDPHKIGVIGFSAGGHLVAAISTHFQKRLYRPVDRADEVSCRPDFAILLYPGHLTVAATAWDARFGNKPFVPPRDSAQQLNPDLHVTSETPPSFLLQAEDDRVDDVSNALVYFAALKKAGVPAELHIYPNGGHAFGLRPADKAVTAWPEVVERWLKSMGMLR